MSDNQVSKYDRRYGALVDAFLHTKPSTIKLHETITGRSETFIIQTVRHEEQGDYIFIEMLDDDGPVRIVLPPKASNLIASQRESLTKRRRSASSKRAMKNRIAAGEVLGFQKRKAS